MSNAYFPAKRLQLLEEAAFCYPIIDHHTHNLLKEEHRSAFRFEGITSEASGAALSDATQSLSFYRATIQLARLFNCEPTFDAVKEARRTMSYDKLLKTCMKPTGIVSLLLDDGLDKVKELCYDYKWHDRLVSTPSKRVVRIETLAQDLIKRLHAEGDDSLETFGGELENALTASCKDPEVVAFKSIACYRTGLDITIPDYVDIKKDYHIAITSLEHTGTLRLAYKALNDFIVRMALQLAGDFRKPVQFHTGLGDNDITLTTANSAVMQPVIKEFPQTIFVLLHSSYPFSREAGYLALVYKNVYLDFGEVFPMVSRDGQCQIISQLLELTPTNKLLWSTDGHWWPETYYLAVLQAREALYDVLSEFVIRDDMTENQAVTVVERTLFHNANKLYNLGLTPQPTNFSIPYSPS